MHRPHDGRASAAETDAETAHSDGEGTALDGHICAGTALAPAQPQRNRAQEANHIGIGTGLAPATSATGVNSTPGHICACLRREWAHPGHICKRDWAGVASVEHAVLRRRYTHSQARSWRRAEGAVRVVARSCILRVLTASILRMGGFHTGWYSLASNLL